jgi:hypothetical protein
MIHRTEATNAIGHAKMKRIKIQMRERQGFPAMVTCFVEIEK